MSGRFDGVTTYSKHSTVPALGEKSIASKENVRSAPGPKGERDQRLPGGCRQGGQGEAEVRDWDHEIDMTGSGRGVVACKKGTKWRHVSDDHR